MHQRHLAQGCSKQKWYSDNPMVTVQEIYGFVPDIFCGEMAPLCAKENKENNKL